jgi:hypothetical protein
MWLVEGSIEVPVLDHRLPFPDGHLVDTSEPGVRAAGGEADSSSKQPAKPTHMNPSPSNALNVTRRQLQRLRHDSVKALEA